MNRAEQIVQGTRVRVFMGAWRGKQGFVLRDFGTSCEVELDGGLRVFKLKENLREEA